MKHLDVVRSFFHSLEDGDLRRALRLCDRDLAVVTPGHRVLDGKDFERVMFALTQALPDLRYEPRELVEDTEIVSGLLDISGTHTRDLAIPLWGLPVVPASGRRVLLPGEPLEVSIRYGKIRRLGSPLQGARGLLGPVQVLGIELFPAGLLG
jgi:hypothetical protein